VRLSGRDYYCGKWGTPQAEAKYHRRIAEWLATGEDMPPQSVTTMAELLAGYAKEVSRVYRRNGRKTPEVYNQAAAIRLVARLYADTPVTDFGIPQLKRCRQAMIDEGRVRQAINRHIARIRQMFEWAAEERLVAPAQLAELKCLRPLRSGRGGRETKRVQPVGWETVRQIEPWVSPTIWAMIQLQWHTGMRSGEMTIMRTCDIDMTGEVWLYRPEHHKTEHHGHERVVAIGPVAQEILKNWVRADGGEYLFQPCEAEDARNTAKRESRQTPPWPSHDPDVRRRRRHQKKRKLADHYNKDSYARAIRRAIAKANESKIKNQKTEIETWTPHQLRHAFGTRARQQFEPDFVRTSLGHSSVDTTLIYAEQDLLKAATVAKALG